MQSCSHSASDMSVLGAADSQTFNLAYCILQNLLVFL